MKGSEVLFLLAIANLMLSFLTECEGYSNVSVLRSGGNDTDMKLEGKEKESKMFPLQNHKAAQDMAIDGKSGEKNKEYAIRYDGMDFDMKTIGKENENEEFLPANSEADTHTKKDGSVYRSKRVKRQYLSNSYILSIAENFDNCRDIECKFRRDGSLKCKCASKPSGKRPRPSPALVLTPGGSSSCYPPGSTLCKWYSNYDYGPHLTSGGSSNYGSYLSYYVLI